jgi:Na+-driven multidrug efflux pump
MVVILLVAGVPGAIGFVLTGGLTSAGRPTTATVAEVCALIVTVVGLSLVLSRYGGVGAACVSFVAYSTSATILVLAARRYLGSPLSSLLVPRRADLRALAVGVRALYHGRRR